MKKNIISLLVMAATLGLSSVASAGIETGKLVIWVNGDKGYDGLAKLNMIIILNHVLSLNYFTL